VRDVCVTVDVEDFFLPRPALDTVFATRGTAEWGIGRIMAVLREFGARATFYVDVYNRTTLTESLLAAACNRVLAEGHELGLHTHPEFPRGKRGFGMEQVMARYPLQVQHRFVERGVELIDRWTGQAPRTHRAGGYGANRDTLRALHACGITSDSSLYAAYAGCPLAHEYHAVNACFEAEGLREVPITLTRTRFGLPLPGRGWLGPTLDLKVDLDWLDLPGLQAQADAVLRHTDAPVVVFLHSYSFLDIERGFVPAPAQVEKFRRLLGWLAARGDVALVPVGEAAARAPIHALPARHLPECRFNAASEPVRWARFAASSLSMSRVKKVLGTGRRTA